MIILEGPDGGGKTTLARYIANKINLPLHTVSRRNGDKSELMYNCRQCVKWGSRMNIQDRVTPISELIYTRALARTHITAVETICGQAVAQLAGMRCVFVYCAPTVAAPKVSEDEPDDTQDITEDEALQRKIRKLYDDLFALEAFTENPISDYDTSAQVVHYDFTVHDNQTDWFYDHLQPAIARSVRLRNNRKTQRMLKMLRSDPAK